MKIAHFFTTKGYLIAESYIKFVQENFKDDYHCFFVVGSDFDNSSNSFPRNRSDLKYFSSYKTNYDDIILAFKTFDKLICHSLSLPLKFQLNMLIRKELMKKFYWVAWGNDLYQWKLKKYSLRNIVANSISLIFRKSVKNFIGIFPPDINYFKQTTNSRARTFYANYVLGLYNPFYRKNVIYKSLEEKLKDKERINILVGHSSAPILNHLAVLTELYRFKKENILIHIPLSYGSAAYGDQVEIAAKELFAEKVICYRELMSKEKYHDFLSTIDIAIFNTDRQIGLGNISPLLFMQKKVYFPKKSVMYSYFTQIGINVADFSDISINDFSHFILPIDVKLGFEYIVRAELNIDVKIQMWDSVFKA